MKYNNSYIMRIAEEEEESKQGIKNLFEEIIRPKTSLIWWRKKVTEVQEAQRVPNQLDPKRPTLKHIIIKMTRLKDKDRIVKATREKQVVTYKGVPPGMFNLFMSLGHKEEESCLGPHIKYTNTNKN